MSAEIKNFTQFMQTIGGGALHEEMSDVMQRTLKELADAGSMRDGTQKATVTLKLEFTLNDHIITAKGTVDAKTPKPQSTSGLFFINEGGNLTRQDPRQRDFDEVMQARQRREHA